MYSFDRMRAHFQHFVIRNWCALNFFLFCNNFYHINERNDKRDLFMLGTWFDEKIQEISNTFRRNDVIFDFCDFIFI